MKTTMTMVLALAGLAAASAAQAAESAPERELRLLGRCAAASNLYRTLMPPMKTPLEPTEADLALWTRIQAATPKLSARANYLAMEVGGPKATAIQKDLKAQAAAQLDPPDQPQLTPRQALDLYAPVLESCLAKADALPDPE